MTLNDYIANYLRDAQYKIAELSVEMDTLQDQGSYQYEKLYRSRLELAMFMDILYEGKWLIRKGVLVPTGVSNASICKITVASIGALAEGDIVYFNNLQGMTQLNGNKYKVKNIFQQVSAGTYTFELYDINTSAPIDSSAYGTWTSGTGNIVISWYNHLDVGTTWTEWEVIAEIEHLRYYHHLNEAPGINFTGHYLKIASTISGGGTGSGGTLPAGTIGQLVTYNSSGDPISQTYDVWAGMDVGQTIASYFTR